MTKFYKNITVLFVMIALFTQTIFQAQNVSSLEVKTATKRQSYLDSLKEVPYPYTLPVLGAKIRKLGFDLPNPTGLMFNYTYGVQDITLSNLAIGGSASAAAGNLTDVSEVAYFNELQSTVNVTNLRYDFWLLPFLNFSLIGGYVQSETAVNMALPFKYEFPAQSNGPLVGWGVLAAAGVGPVFVSLDYNMAWTFMPKLDEPSKSSVFDARIGHTFDFHNKQAMNLSVLVGAQWLKISEASSGYIDVADLLGVPDATRGEAAEQLDDWYNELPYQQQEIFYDLYNTLDGFLSDGNDGELHYEFDKKLYYPWSMTVGASWQINKRWMLSGLYTFLGSREQFTAGLAYRFGWNGKTLLSGVQL